MKQLFIICLILGALSSCNNQNSTVKDNPGNSSPVVVDRAKVIEELKKMKQTMATKKLEQMVDVLSLPQADSVLGLYIDDSMQLDYKKNGNRITKEMFIHYYSEFSTYINLSELDDILENSDLDKLSRGNTFDFSAKNKEGECIESFHIEFEHDLIYLTYTWNGFTDKKKEKEDTEGGCEYSSRWGFKFENGKLKFINHFAAG